MTGAQMIIEALKKERIEVIFGYPGGAVIDIYDELYKNPEIKHVLVRHEQGAAHAADGYARSTGKVGVVLVTSGPGSTNTVTGIATAYMDSIPIVVLTGQVPTKLIGNDAFQEVDTTGITRPITKHNFLIKRIEDLPKILKSAFYIASTGRPGPVVVDIPKDIQQAKGEFNYPDEIELRSYNPVYEPHVKQIEKAYSLLEQAERPVLLLGGGVISSGASPEAIKLAELLNLPVTMTLMGLGSFPGEHEQSLGMLGMHGTYYANMAVANCDVLLAVGARFDDRVTGKVDAFAPGAKIIHIDIDPTSIQKNVKVHVPIVADCKRALTRILEIVRRVKKPKRYWKERFKEWWEQIDIWRKRYPLSYKKDPNYIKPQFVIEKLYEFTKGEAIIATEVGQNQMWAAQYYKFKYPRTLITSGGLGTMGFGFPASIGAQIGNPDKLVIDVAGDGSIQMNIQELATAVEQKLPIKIIILNNGYLGMVRQWQGLFYGKRYSQVKFHILPDFVKLAEAYGAVGMKITRPEEVEPVLKKVLNMNSLVILDVHIASEENVFPMVPAGKSTTEMILV
ncbi:MAG: biosynthetic-type acetolactate synthase large subunit [Thermodesulfobacterium sp.]|nr:biosynthetic-type acetolactate synthase large subunit [Thermodesulfobacterium sp.]